jgi:hypothetical protein
MVAVASLTLVAAVSFAQQRGGGMDRDRSTTAQQERQMDRDQTYDRERLLDRDMTRDTDRDRDQGRDMLHMQDRDRLRDEDLYGSQLMSAEEREQYRLQLTAAESDRDWAQIRAQHEQAMQMRARERGVELVPPVYGEFMMTAAERAEYRGRLEAATTEQERVQIRAAHAEQMQQRAQQLGVDLPPVAD